MSKKKILLAGFLIVIVLLYAFLNSQTKSISEDALKFKNEYESLNKKGYKEIKIPEENQIKYSNYKEVVEILKSGTGIIYLGFPECPWCRNAVPVLLDAANETGVDTIYYFNALSIRDKKHLDEDGNIVVDDKGTEEYKKLVEILYDYLGEYEGLNDSSIKRIYFPTVIFVKNGDIKGLHVSTVDSQVNPKEPLTNEQYEELKEIYVKNCLKISGASCSNDMSQKC